MVETIISGCDGASIESVEVLHGEDEIMAKVEYEDLEECEHFGISETSGRGWERDDARLYADNDLTIGVFEHDA